MSFLKKSAQVLIIGTVGQAIAVASTILFARWMGPTNLGSFSTCMAIAGLMATIGLLGFPMLQMRDVARNADDGPIQAVTPITISGLAMVVLTVLGAALLGQLFYHSNWMPALGSLRPHIPLLLPLLLTGLTVPKYAAQTLIGLGFARSATLVNQVFQPILLLGLAAMWFALDTGERLSPSSRIVMELLAVLVTAAALYILLFRKTPISFSPNRDQLSRGKIQATWLSAFNFAGIGLSQVLFTTTDVLVLGLFVNSEQVGIYKVAAVASTLLLYPMDAMSSVYAPRIASDYRNGKSESVSRNMSRLSYRVFLLLSPLLLLFFMAPEWAVTIFFGKSFADASTVLSLLVVGVVVRLMLGPVGWALTMTGCENLCMKLFLIGASLNLVLNLVLVPVYGTLGAATATSLATVCTYFAMAKVLRSRTGIFTWISPIQIMQDLNNYKWL